MKAIAFILILAPTLFAGSPTTARQIRLQYEIAQKEWVQLMQQAISPQAQANAWAKKPDIHKTGRRIWAEIRNNLDESWTLEPAVWFITNAPKIAFPVPEPGSPLASKQPGILIRNAVEKYHLLNPKIGPYCVALTINPDRKALNFLKTVEAKNPHPVVQGAAALGQSYLLKKIGNNPDIIRQRLNLIREAIKKSNGLAVGKTTVAALAESEIYIIQNLSVGRPIPKLLGIDIAGKPIKLANYRGKVIVLAFWNSWMPDSERTLDLLRKLDANLKNKNALLLGVSNDNPKVLREMTAQQSVTWKNITDIQGKITKDFHIDILPKIYIIDQNGIIKYIGAPGAFVDITVDSLLKN